MARPEYPSAQPGQGVWPGRSGGHGPRVPAVYPPVRNDDRIILHFDYDCFYAQVVQNNPPQGMTVADLAGKAVGITQKSILATCNYEARRLGVRKLMRISDAVRVLPTMILVDGEDLSPFRDVSKTLYRLMRDIVSSGIDKAQVPVERLGLDEVFIDVTFLVDANVERLQKRPASSWSTTEFFYLGGSDGEDANGRPRPSGFEFDCTRFCGCIVGAQQDSGNAGLANCTSPAQAREKLRFVLGSHLASYLRSRIEHDAGYTASAGIATSKVLAKLAGKQHKPANQTTILSLSNDGCEDHDGDDGDSVVHAFMDVLPLRDVPGIGYKTATLLTDFIHGKKDSGDGDNAALDEQEGDSEQAVTVADVRLFPGMSPRLLDSVLGSAQTAGAAGSAIPSGERVWQLLHGVDSLPVRGGRDLPTQISIEDTYAGPRQGTLKPDAANAVAAELRMLATSLLKRMHIDLRSDVPKSLAKGDWVVRPRTLRLTLRPQYPDVTDNRTTEKNYHFSRMSRSEPLPSYVTSLTTPREQIVERLVQGSLVPMFRKLAASVRARNDSQGSSSSRNTASKSRMWTIGLLNVCVANMAPMAGDGGIAAMFQRVNGVTSTGELEELEELEELKGEQTPTAQDNYDNDNYISNDGNDNDDDDIGGWDDGDHAGTEGSPCKQCGQFLPAFAQEAHARFHLLGED
ncbi:dna polymerase iota [Ophiostoma piceae UAMH 11346]|uniref:Dna polymerase iota n=1 Tax=Ophiostoma piceae (strain UAMH 11346) TaxID=1262450 RepID=S3D393_OPHP1|nr:dna polymerase iota [Ophiostoma piceae UAMH 11346]